MCSIQQLLIIIVRLYAIRLTHSGTQSKYCYYNHGEWTQCIDKSVTRMNESVSSSAEWQKHSDMWICERIYTKGFVI